MNETEQTTFSVPSPGELEQLTELHKAMGDYTRMRILWYLMQKDSCVSELAQKMEVTESAISHQLRALRIVRLVQSRKAGKSVIYSLQDEHIRWILEETYTGPWMQRTIRDISFINRENINCAITVIFSNPRFSAILPELSVYRSAGQ